MEKIFKEMTIEELRREVSRLRLKLDDSRELSTAREKVMAANITRLESMYDKLTQKMREIRSKGHEIKVLNTLNDVIATASKYVGLGEILYPTLDVVMHSIEELEKGEGKDVRVTGGGVFIFDEKRERLTLGALRGIQPESLGCRGGICPGECLCGLAAETGELVTTPYCLKDERHSPAHPEVDVPEHAHITIPLKTGDKVTGVMFLYLSPPGYVPTEADRIIFRAIGGYLGLHIDRAMLYDTVHQLAIRDGLTGLYNHREFKRQLDIEMKRSGRNGLALSVLLIDIDHFKKVNDTYGHQAGDYVLIRLSVVLKNMLRGTDLAARYGGEEFMLILPDTSMDGALTLAGKIRERVEGMVVVFDKERLGVTISIGAATYPADSTTEGGIIKAADTALYAAKEGGRNRVCAFRDLPRRAAGVDEEAAN